MTIDRIRTSAYNGIRKLGLVKEFGTEAVGSGVGNVIEKACTYHNVIMGTVKKIPCFKTLRSKFFSFVLQQMATTPNSEDGRR